MQPKTKIQHRIWDMSKNLPPIDKKQKEFAFSKVLDHVGHRSKKGITCMDCGQFFEDTSTRKRSTCPHCNTKLTVEVTRKRKFSQRRLMAILDVVDGIQVSRTVEVYGHHEVGHQVRHFIFEIYQHFFEVEGKNHVVARFLNMNGSSFYGDLEVRRTDEAYCYQQSVDKVCTGYRVLPMFKKMGFKGNLHWVTPYTFFTRIQHSNRAETLLKANQPSMFFNELQRHDAGAYRFWNSIKICIRNKYKVTDARSYYDYLSLLQRCGKDLRSPKYVCPKNFKKEHDRYVKKVREIDRKRSEAEKIRRARENEAQYLKDKQAFFGLCFVSGDITVKVLESVQEFVQESLAHKHCVFGAEYFKKENSLVFSATVKGVQVETVELSLKDMQVVQSRGLHNKASEYNDDIKKLVDKNIGQVRKIYDQLQSAN